MKRFEYRLQTKLDLTVKQEEAARTELARCQREYRLQVARLNHLHQKQSSVYEKMRGSQRQVVELSQVILLKKYLQVIKGNILQQAEKVALAQVEVDRAHGELLGVMIERKTLQKLRERKWHEYVQEFNRQEQKAIDEVAMTTYWRVNQSERRFKL